MGDAATIAERAGRRARALWRRRPNSLNFTSNPTRLALRAALALAFALTLTLLLLALLSSLAPSWWSDALRLTAVPSDVGERVERAIVSETHRARPQGETWAMAITQEQANAWLRDRLPKWASNRGIRAAPGAAVRVRFVENAIIVGAQEREGARVFTASLRPELRSDGSLWARLLSVSAGRMPAPTSLALDGLHSMIGNTQTNGNHSPVTVLTGKSPAVEKAEVRLEDGRRVHPREIRVEPGRIIILWETVPPARASSGS
ncbi:MAG: hypothetical protein AB7G17_09665 [Phycisphaerales bacterium]